MKPEQIHGMMSGTDRGMRSRFLRAVTRALEPGYWGIIRTRNAIFDAGWRGSLKLGRPTISVGNLTTGGTGKTPMVIYLVERLLALGAKPGILLRGYRAGEEGSDEAALYRATFGGRVPVAADPDRVAAARRLLAANDDVDVLVLDDAFQRRQVHRDLDLVLLDATNPWGYGHVLPRGMLREPVASLRRADGVVLTHVDEVAESELAALRQRVMNLTGKLPVSEVSHLWNGFAVTPSQGDEFFATSDALREMRVVGVCGIGNPKAFERRLRQHCQNVASCIALSDHAAYDEVTLTELANRCEAQDAVAIVTTEKDFVKWTGSPTETFTQCGLAIYRPRLKLKFSDTSDSDDIDAMLSALIHK